MSLTKPCKMFDNDKTRANACSKKQIYRYIDSAFIFNIFMYGNRLTFWNVFSHCQVLLLFLLAFYIYYGQKRRNFWNYNWTPESSLEKNALSRAFFFRWDIREEKKSSGKCVFGLSGHICPLRPTYQVYSDFYRKINILVNKINLL